MSGKWLSSKFEKEKKIINFCENFVKSTYHQLVHLQQIFSFDHKQLKQLLQRCNNKYRQIKLMWQWTTKKKINFCEKGKKMRKNLTVIPYVPRNFPFLAELFIELGCNDPSKLGFDQFSTFALLLEANTKSKNTNCFIFIKMT